MSEIVFFTKEQAQTKAEIMAKMGLCTTPEEFAEIQEQLLALNVAEGKAKDSLKSIFSQLSNFNVGFNELLKAGVISNDDAWVYANQQGWCNKLTDSDIKAIAIEKFGMVVPKNPKTDKGKMVVNVFKTADFPEFVVPTDKDDKTKKLVADEFEWDLFKKYGPTPNNEFINAIKNKGYEWVIANSLDSFKKWLRAPHKKTVGRGAGDTIYENGRDFLFRFEIKNAEADIIIKQLIEAGKLKIAEDEPVAETVEAVEESQTVQDEFVQEEPQAVEANPKKKK